MWALPLTLKLFLIFRLFTSARLVHPLLAFLFSFYTGNIKKRSPFLHCVKFHEHFRGTPLADSARSISVEYTINYTKDGRQGRSDFCGFYHEPLRKLDVHAWRSNLRLICAYEPYILQNKKVSAPKDYGKNYMNDRPSLVHHLLHNGLLLYFPKTNRYRYTLNQTFTNPGEETNTFLPSSLVLCRFVLLHTPLLIVTARI